MGGGPGGGGGRDIPSPHPPGDGPLDRDGVLEDSTPLGTALAETARRDAGGPLTDPGKWLSGAGEGVSWSYPDAEVRD